MLDCSPQPLVLPTENVEELPLSRRKEVVKKFNWNHGSTLTWQLAILDNHVLIAAVCYMYMFVVRSSHAPTEERQKKKISENNNKEGV